MRYTSLLLGRKATNKQTSPCLIDWRLRALPCTETDQSDDLDSMHINLNGEVEVSWMREGGGGSGMGTGGGGEGG